MCINFLYAKGKRFYLFPKYLKLCKTHLTRVKD